MKAPKLFRWTISILALVGLLALTAVFSFGIGSAAISLRDILSLLLNPAQSLDKSILLQIRLPRIILCAAAGGALSLSGVLLQGVFRNPLVEPYTLGIAGGAAFGVCLTILLKPSTALGPYLFPAAGFAGAGITIAILYLLSVRRGILRIEDLLLTGVMFSFVTSSGLMLLMSLSRAQDLQSIVFWMMGSFGRSDWPVTRITVIGSLLGLFLSFFLARELNALALGEEEAIHIGASVELTKRTAFILASFLTGLAISSAGVIGFVGLVVPHIVRRLIGSDHRILLIASFLSGAVFLLLCDTAARTIISPIELPVGVITGIIGGVIFISVLSFKRKAL